MTTPTKRRIPTHPARACALLDTGFDAECRPLAGQLHAHTFREATSDDDQFNLDRFQDRRVPGARQRY